jgi:hypothetical protein
MATMVLPTAASALPLESSPLPAPPRAYLNSHDRAERGLLTPRLEMEPSELRNRQHQGERAPTLAGDEGLPATPDSLISSSTPRDKAQVQGMCIAKE